jgi:hypothetical protein
LRGTIGVIEVHSVTKRYKETLAVDDLSIQVVDAAAATVGGGRARPVGGSETGDSGVTSYRAELLPNGHILIADENNNRIIEVNRDHKVVWQYGSPSDTTTLNGAAIASRLPNGHTLITDSNDNRVVEVTLDKDVVWSYVTDIRPGSMANPLPTRAVRLGNGNTLISDQFNDQVIEVNRHHQIVFSQGQIQVDGNGPDQLNAPYDAKVVGDYTGLTFPGGSR